MKRWLLLAVVCAATFFLWTYKAGGGWFFVVKALPSFLIALLAANFAKRTGSGIFQSLLCWTFIAVAFIEIAAILLNFLSLIHVEYSSAYPMLNFEWCYNDYDSHIISLATCELIVLLIYPVAGLINGVYRVGMAVVHFVTSRIDAWFEASYRDLVFWPKPVVQAVSMQGMRGKTL